MSFRSVAVLIEDTLLLGVAVESGCPRIPAQQKHIGRLADMQRLPVGVYIRVKRVLIHIKLLLNRGRC